MEKERNETIKKTGQQKMGTMWKRKRGYKGKAKNA